MSSRGPSLRRLDGALVLSAAGSREILRDESGSSERVRALFADVRALRRSEADDAGDRDVPVTAEVVRQSMAPQILSDGTRLYAVVSARGRDVGSTFVPFLAGRELLIAWKRLDGPILARIAEIHGLAALTLAPVSKDATSTGLSLENGRGETVAEITWLPDRPGDLMQQRILPIVGVGLGFSALMFGAVALHFHRTTKNLAETDAIAKDLLGRDPLSGLANRMLFNERLDRELANVRDGAPGLAVVFIDLDRFKDVNDSYGHQAGDDLIQLVARRILDILPDRDTLARLGGDEFAIIQTQLASFEQAEALCRRILDLLTRPFAVAHTQVTIGASIGVALAPEHARSRESLMKLADTALYQAKSEGRNRVSFFQTHMDETLRMRKVVEDDLRKAITGDQLILHYQPLFSSDGEKIVGLEALVRWPHPERGLISPSEFIAIAEERGLVIPLGEWVLRRACEDGKRWPNLRVAVNVSAIQFRHRGFVESVTRALEETGFDASRLELELTEGVVVGDEDAAEAAMIELRALGVHLALDDFGTGYSSLIYLRRFAFDKIKIDRSFLESMEATGESAILVHSIVHLGRALGLVVTAEGVETKEQHRFLQALGCHQLQGYLFSRPVPREEIDRMVAAQVSAPASAA
jgi:diguanylate cyclase (GGDEF)-like protein